MPQLIENKQNHPVLIANFEPNEIAKKSEQKTEIQKRKHRAGEAAQKVDIARINQPFAAGRSSSAGKREDLIVEDDVQKRWVNVESAIVLNKSQPLEFIHKNIHAGARGANYLCQHSLGHFSYQLLRLVLLAITSEQQEGTRQAFFGGVKELIHQILFQADASRQQVRQEAVGEGSFSVEFANHLIFLYGQRSAMSDSRRRSHTERQPQQASFTEKLARPQNGNDGLLAECVQHGEFHAAFLDVEDLVGWIALAENNLADAELHDLLVHTCGIEERLRVKPDFSLGLSYGRAADCTHDIPPGTVNRTVIVCTVTYITFKPKLYL